MKKTFSTLVLFSVCTMALNLSPHNIANEQLPNNIQNINFSIWNGNWIKNLKLPSSPNANTVVNIHNMAWYGTKVDLKKTDLASYVQILNIVRDSNVKFKYNVSSHKWHVGNDKSVKNSHLIVDNKVTTYYTYNGAWASKLNLPALVKNDSLLIIKSSASYDSTISGHLEYGQEFPISSGDTYVFRYNIDSSTWKAIGIPNYIKIGKYGYVHNTRKPVNLNPFYIDNQQLPSKYNQINFLLFNGNWASDIKLPEQSKANDIVNFANNASYDTHVDVSKTDIAQYVKTLIFVRRAKTKFTYNASLGKWHVGINKSVHNSTLVMEDDLVVNYSIYNGAWADTINLPKSAKNHSLLIIDSSAYLDTTIQGNIDGASSYRISSGDTYVFKYNAGNQKWTAISVPRTIHNGQDGTYINVTKPLTEVKFANGNWCGTLELPASAQNGAVVMMNSTATLNTTINSVHTNFKGTMVLKKGDYYKFIYNSAKNVWEVKESPVRKYEVNMLISGNIPNMSAPLMKIHSADANWEEVVTLPSVAKIDDRVIISTDASYDFTVNMRNKEFRMRKGESLEFIYSSKGWTCPAKKGLKTPPAGLVLRGKANNSYCDFPRTGVEGGYCQIAWADLEPSEGNFDFHLIDDALKEARNYNSLHNTDFKVLLRIRTGVYSPEWIKNRVGSIDWYFKNKDDKHRLPIFWEEPFQNEYKKLMQKLADKYDYNNNVGLVAASMCMTKHTEIMWNRTGRTEVNQINMQHLRQAHDTQNQPVPYSNEKDYACLRNQIQIHKDVWENTPTIFGSHLYQVYNISTGDHSSKYDKTIALFDYCTSTLGKRCILGNNSLLHTENNTDANINRAITYVSNKGFNTYYQTHVFADSTKGFNFDNLIVAINHASSWGAMMVELPMGWDCSYGNEMTEDKLKCTDASYKSIFLKDGRDALKANIKE